MRAQLLHLSGPQRGRTVTYREPVVHIGRASSSECALPVDAVADEHAKITWIEDDCRFHLQGIDGPVFVNGQQVDEVYLRDGDQLEFGVGGPRARFRIYVPIGAVCKPVRRMLSDAKAVAEHSDAGTATRMLTKDLLTQATPQLKIGFPLLVVGAALLVAWLGGWFVSRSIQQREQETADHVAMQEIAELRKQQAEVANRIEQLSQADDVFRRVQREWSRGVCLIHGIYRMEMPDGSWFEARPGKPYQSEYTGSGFLVSADGQIVTNRHVALPWTEDGQDKTLVEAGAKPKFVHFTATFPGRAPVDIGQDTIRRRKDTLDVAVVRLEPNQVEGIPILPLREDGTEGDDQRAIVVGYPTGLGALLARADSDTLDALRQTAASMSDAISQLATADKIRPVITKGVVSNAENNIIAYDASTTGGGSGGPVFSGRGDVIAVNFAVQRNFVGNNLGVPIRFARALLE
ncbi:MAG: trypsin-like peptidase domain-containing protein [Planctomycetota bacterium]